MRTYWANIIAREGEKPHKMIVTDGVETIEIPCSNSTVKTLRRTCYDLYNIPPARVFVSVVSDDDENYKFEEKPLP